MRRAIVLGAIVGGLGCSSLAESGAPVAIEVITPSPPIVEIADTITLHARVLDQAGDSIAATIRWRTSDTAFVSVDSVTGRFTGRAAGVGHVQAVSGTLVGPFATFTVRLRADTILVATDSLDLPAIDTASAILLPRVTDSTGAGSSSHFLAFTIVAPSAATARLSGDRTADTVTTDGTGAPATPVRVRNVGVTVGDSVIVQVEAHRFGGSLIPGSGRKIRVFFK